MIDSILKKRRSKDPSVVGLEIESGSIGAAEVSVNGIARVSTAAVEPLPPEAFTDGEVSDPEAVTAALRRLFETHELSRKVRLGIANQRVVVRTLRLPAIEDPGELDSAIRFSAQEQIPMPPEQAVIDHRVVGGVAAVEDGPPQIDVMVVAARRDMIAASLKPLYDADLKPVGVDLAAFGMIRALGHLGAGDPEASEPQPSAILYCSIGDVTNLAVAKGRSCLFNRVSPVGLDDITASLVTASGLTPEHARMWLHHVGLEAPAEQVEGDPGIISQARGALEVGAASLLDELRLSLDFYGAQETATPIERIVICGPGSAIPGLAGAMEPGLGLPISTDRPEALKSFDAATAARLTVPYGLALDL